MAAKAFSLKDLLEDSPPKDFKNLSFEDGLRLLEELVAHVESGELPLNQAVLSYERGVALVEHLRNLLSGAEQKLKVLQKPRLEAEKNEEE